MIKKNKDKALYPFAVWNKEHEADCLIFGGEVVPLLAESFVDAVQKYAKLIFKTEPPTIYYISAVDENGSLRQFSCVIEPETVENLKFKVYEK